MNFADESLPGNGDGGSVRESIGRAVIAAIARMAEPNDGLADSLVAQRRARAEQFDEIAAAVESSSWRAMGFRSPTDWLATATSESIGHCTTSIAIARRLAHMPHVREAFRTGELAESAVRLLTETWHEDIAAVFARDEQMLVDWARDLTHRDFKLVIETWRARAHPDREAATAAEQYERRNLSLSGLLDGMGKLDGVLDPEGFATVREALRTLAQRTNGDTRTPGQRRADALVGLAKMALDHLGSDTTPARKRHRPRIIATATIDDLQRRSRGGTLDTSSERIPLTADALRRLACDAGIHRYITDAVGTVVDHGRHRRTVSDAQFDRLIVRDHGCRICGFPSWGCDAHHAIHWLDDGDTDDDNLVLLCWHHHHLVHEQHWSIQPLGAGHFTLHDPRGRDHPLRPPIVGLALGAPVPDRAVYGLRCVAAPSSA